MEHFISSLFKHLIVVNRKCGPARLVLVVNSILTSTLILRQWVLWWILCWSSSRKVADPSASSFGICTCRMQCTQTSNFVYTIFREDNNALSVWFARKSSWPRSVHSLLLLSISLSLIFSVIIVLFLSRISESSKSRWWFMFHIWRYVLGLSLFQCRDLNCVILGVRALLFWTIPSIFTPGWYTHCFTCQLHWVASS